MHLKPMTEQTIQYLLRLYPTVTREEILDVYYDTPELLKTMIHIGLDVPELCGIALLRVHAHSTEDKKARQAAFYCMYELIAQYATPQSQVREMLAAHGVDSF